RYISFILFFFFQAEDGIRDFHVTGVQTCALPICTARPPMETYQRARRSLRARMRRLRLRAGVSKSSPGAREEALMSCSAISFMRSEERRVGKECRSRWSPRQ